MYTALTYGHEAESKLQSWDRLYREMMMKNALRTNKVYILPRPNEQQGEKNRVRTCLTFLGAATDTIMGTKIPITWFNQGLRLIYFANPHAPKEIAHYCPRPKENASNDIDIDNRGLVYVLGRFGGMPIAERT